MALSSWSSEIGCRRRRSRRRVAKKKPEKEAPAPKTEESERDTDQKTPQSPDPNKPKPGSNTNTEGIDPLNHGSARTGGQTADPILLGDGSFDLSQTDLLFPARVVRWRSRALTTLAATTAAPSAATGFTTGTWLERLNPDNTPTWAMPYCLGIDQALVPNFEPDPPGLEPRTTCLILHRGDASSQLVFTRRQLLARRLSKNRNNSP
nr:hypothetical protein [Edaphobacter aggregans]